LNTNGIEIDFSSERIGGKTLTVLLPLGTAQEDTVDFYSELFTKLGEFFRCLRKLLEILVFQRFANTEQPATILHKTKTGEKSAVKTVYHRVKFCVKLHHFATRIRMVNPFQRDNGHPLRTPFSSNPTYNAHSRKICHFVKRVKKEICWHPSPSRSS